MPKYTVAQLEQDILVREGFQVVIRAAEQQEIAVAGAYTTAFVRAMNGSTTVAGFLKRLREFTNDRSLEVVVFDGKGERVNHRRTLKTVRGSYQD